MPVAENGHYRSAVDAGRIVEHRAFESGLLQLCDASVPELNHFFFRAELQAAGGTRFDARRLESDFDSIDAQRALRHFSRRLAELRNVERAAGRAITAADACRRIHIDDPVRILNDRSRCGTRREAARLRAVHALIFAHEPHRAAVIGCAFVEADQIPELRIELGQRLIGPFLMRGQSPEVIPFHTRGFACLAANAGGRIDVLRDHFLCAETGLGSPHRGGGASDFECLFAHRRLLTPSPDSRGTLCTPASRRSGRRPTASGNSPAVLRGLLPLHNPNESGSRCARAACHRHSSPASDW